MSDTKKTLPVPDESNDSNNAQPNQALEALRNKVNNLYHSEPSYKEESQEVVFTGAHSRHQKFIKELQDSKRPQKEKEIIWHNYYLSLDEQDKKRVWHEYYEYQSKLSNKDKIDTDLGAKPKQISKVNSSSHATNSQVFGAVESSSLKQGNAKSLLDIKQKIKNKVARRDQFNKRQNFQSIIFGMGMGLIVLFIFMFGFFNERFIAPFITPSKTASSSPIIIDPNDSGKVSPDPRVIIPKINVDVPVVYNLTSNEEAYIQNALNEGVVHYPGTAVPGQKGNVVIVGHSSNNIFNPGKYKFAFVLLNRMQEGDTFILNYNSQRYVYKVYKKEVVKPNDVQVMAPQPDKESVATLITCDPPGTDVNRLVVFGEQIFPSPDNNVASNNSDVSSTITEVPGNSPSLLGRIFGWQ